MKILIADSLADGWQDVLTDDDIHFDAKSSLSPEELLTIIGNYEGLIVRSATQVTREVIQAGKALRAIGRAGAGIDNINIEAATERGIIVLNAPGGNTISTAEHTVAMLLALARNIPQATASIRSGKWDRKSYTGVELEGKTLGIIGVGRVGLEVARRARAFGMRVIAFDPVFSSEMAEQNNIQLASNDEIFSEADYITLHAPLIKETHHVIDDDAIGRCKQGVRILNCARGGLVDEAALLRGIESGKVAGAALDVFEKEPPPADHPLLARDEVIATPHLGASTAQAQLNVAIAIAQQVRDFLCKGVVSNAVNLPSVSADELEDLRPFIRLAEKLGLLQGQLQPDGIREVEVEFAGDVTEVDVQPLTLAVLKGLLEPWVGERVNYVNASHIAQQRGIRVIESKAAVPEDFVSLVSVRVQGGGGSSRVSGTLIGRTQPRIVRIDDFLLEAIPEGATLLIQNGDRPGVVGHIGSILGESGINISRMQLALSLDGSHALQLLNVDPAPGGEALASLRQIAGVESVHLIDLGGRVT